MNGLLDYFLLIVLVKVQIRAEEFNSTQIFYQIQFTVTESETMEVMNFTEQDFILSFYSALCEATTYHYELTIFDNGTINTVEWNTFFANNLNDLEYSGIYHCQGEHLKLTCVRLQKTSQCSDTLVTTRFRETFLCDKASIEICPSHGQTLTIVNLLEVINATAINSFMLTSSIDVTLPTGYYSPTTTVEIYDQTSQLDPTELSPLASTNQMDPSRIPTYATRTIITTPYITLAALMPSSAMTFDVSTTYTTTSMESETMTSLLSVFTIVKSVDEIITLYSESTPWGIINTTLPSSNNSVVSHMYATTTEPYTYLSLTQTVIETSSSTLGMTATHSTITSVVYSCVTTSPISQDSDAIPSHVVAIVVSILSAALLISLIVIICLLLRLRRLTHRFIIQSPDNSIPCLMATTYL